RTVRRPARGARQGAGRLLADVRGPAHAGGTGGAGDPPRGALRGADPPRAPAAGQGAARAGPAERRRHLPELMLHFEERPAAGEPSGLVVLHHGRGTSEQDLLPLADVLDPERALPVVA